MGTRVLITSGLIAIAIILAIFIGRSREDASTSVLLESLHRSLSRPVAGTVDFNTFSSLPPPVARYFKHVLTNQQKLIKTAELHQSGVLRTSTSTDNWSSFNARQIVVPYATGFVWNAKVEMPLATHVRVIDSYVSGIGAGRVSILSALTVASESGDPELNSGALHRYLAEAVWYPTALLPQSGVSWSPVSDRSAMATIMDRGTRVSLEFIFNDADEVVGIYSPGRFGRFDGTYKQVPWEGHFRDYQLRGNMRVPVYGEVGWHVDDTLQLVWKGNLVDVQYQFGD